MHLNTVYFPCLKKGSTVVVLMNMIFGFGKIADDLQLLQLKYKHFINQGIKRVLCIKFLCLHDTHNENLGRGADSPRGQGHLEWYLGVEPGKLRHQGHVVHCIRGVEESYLRRREGNNLTGGSCNYEKL